MSTQKDKKQRSPRPVADVNSGGMGFMQILLLIVIGAVVLVGLFWVFESLGGNTKFGSALTKILGSVATVFTTYFLINRALRLRERESDGILVSFIGFIDYLVQTYDKSYGSGPQDDEDAQELLANVQGLGYEKIEAYAEHLAVEPQSLPRFLMDSLCWPNYLATAEERLNDIYEASQQVTSLLGVCSPKMATAAMDVIDNYSDLYRDDLPVIRRGLRAFRKLEWMANYGLKVNDREYYDAMYDDISESVAAILEAMQYVFQKLPASLEEELRSSLTQFRQKLPASYHEAYDRELEAVGEVLDID